MSPSAKRILPFIALTVLYWPVALFLLAVSQMGDCYVPGAECEQGRALFLRQMLAVEAGLYLLFLYGLWKLRARP